VGRGSRGRGKGRFRRGARERTTGRRRRRRSRRRNRRCRRPRRRRPNPARGRRAVRCRRPTARGACPRRGRLPRPRPWAGWRSRARHPRPCPSCASACRASSRVDVANSTRRSRFKKRADGTEPASDRRATKNRLYALRATRLQRESSRLPDHSRRGAGSRAGAPPPPETHAGASVRVRATCPGPSTAPPVAPHPAPAPPRPPVPGARLFRSSPPFPRRRARARRVSSTLIHDGTPASAEVESIDLYTVRARVLTFSHTPPPSGSTDRHRLDALDAVPSRALGGDVVDFLPRPLTRASRRRR